MRKKTERSSRLLRAILGHAQQTPLASAEKTNATELGTLKLSLCCSPSIASVDKAIRGVSDALPMFARQPVRAAMVRGVSALLHSPSEKSSWQRFCDLSFA